MLVIICFCMQHNLASSQESMADIQNTVQNFKVSLDWRNVWHLTMYVYCTQTEVDKQTSELMISMLLPLLQQLTVLVTQHSASIIKTSTELRDQVYTLDFKISHYGV